jgi:hypothetical protein
MFTYEARVCQTPRVNIKSTSLYCNHVRSCGRVCTALTVATAQLEAFPLYSRIFSIRTYNCPIPIFQWNVWTAATTTTTIRPTTVGNACRQSYVLTLPSPVSCRVDIHLPVVTPLLTFYLFMAVSCSEYLCQDTLVCVSKPIDCPCPNVQDIKCVVPDAQDGSSGTRLCIRGGTDCAQIEKLAKKFSQ